MFFTKIKEIDIHELKRLNKKKILLIDIQPPEKYVYKHIPNSVNINKKAVLKSPDSFIIQKAYIVCETGSKSKKLVKKLTSKGKDVVWVNGGVQQFSHHFPTVSTQILNKKNQK